MDNSQLIIALIDAVAIIVAPIIAAFVTAKLNSNEGRLGVAEKMRSMKSIGAAYSLLLFSLLGYAFSLHSFYRLTIEPLLHDPYFTVMFISFAFAGATSAILVGLSVALIITRREAKRRDSNRPPPPPGY
ncbi:MAG: hypothetical protein QOD32_1120 [Pyrinomonadaceae bacterium]|jgi:multisubunit Na+/H+ antiporter MnhB subunit|nr:hypothetical protein [Pyrinomonadaceae bacterium]